VAQVELILLTNNEENLEIKNLQVQMTYLLGGYAIAVLPEEQVEDFLKQPGILPSRALKPIKVPDVTISSESLEPPTAPLLLIVAEPAI